jgi:hypothetical protein
VGNDSVVAFDTGRAANHAHQWELTDATSSPKAGGPKTRVVMTTAIHVVTDPRARLPYDGFAQTRSKRRPSERFSCKSVDALRGRVDRNARD